MLEQLHDAIRRLGYSPKTEKSYAHWIHRYILFHKKRHPAELDAAHIEAFLTHLAVERRVSPSTQNQALNALLFLYKQLLGKDIGLVQHAVRAKEKHRLPVVLSREEVSRLLQEMSGKYRLMAELLYGSGLRSIECCRLRVQDIDLDYGEIIVRAGKGGKDRRTLLPRKLIPAIQKQLIVVEKERRRETWNAVWVASRCPMRWHANTRTRPRNSTGGTCSRPGRWPRIRTPES